MSIGSTNSDGCVSQWSCEGLKESNNGVVIDVRPDCVPGGRGWHRRRVRCWGWGKPKRWVAADASWWRLGGADDCPTTSGAVWLGEAFPGAAGVCNGWFGSDNVQRGRQGHCQVFWGAGDSLCTVILCSSSECVSAWRAYFLWVLTRAMWIILFTRESVCFHGRNRTCVHPIHAGIRAWTPTLTPLPPSLPRWRTVASTPMALPLHVPAARCFQTAWTGRARISSLTWTQHISRQTAMVIQNIPVSLPPPHPRTYTHSQAHTPQQCKYLCLCTYLMHTHICADKWPPTPPVHTIEILYLSLSIYMHIYIHVYIYIYLYLYMYIYVSIYIYIYIFMYICTNIYIWRYIQIYIYNIYIIYIYISIYIYMCVSLFIYI